MTGTVEGGRKAAKTNLEKHGRDFYRHIGRIGGSRGRTGGFASELVGSDGLTGFERARVVGAKGGRVSIRGMSHEALEEMDGQERRKYLRKLDDRRIARLNAELCNEKI